MQFYILTRIYIYTWVSAGVSSGVSWMVGMSSFSHGGFFLCRLLFLLPGSSMLASSPYVCQLDNTNKRKWVCRTVRTVKICSQTRQQKKNPV